MRSKVSVPAVGGVVPPLPPSPAEPDAAPPASVPPPPETGAAPPAATAAPPVPGTSAPAVPTGDAVPALPLAPALVDCGPPPAPLPQAAAMRTAIALGANAHLRTGRTQCPPVMTP